ncbi:CAMPATH-1 antigen [Equus asinus]|uniref:CAMPATH-1 antigen n=3 Tax=Equus TaxID=9789 RepID=A0A9L0RYQ5_HORSE|nr:PREDICTED: CAMPATH-1 antigen isoform X1 [Equus przewalskii]XP_014710476.1 CAMPATH-1 antigen isoform X1 [Equus asinus]XP_023491201.1 CAMPATH-1 antigen isoform X1 [Equus caballus]
MPSLRKSAAGTLTARLLSPPNPVRGAASPPPASTRSHACLRLPCLVVQKQSSQKEPADSPAFISKSCCQESHQDPPKMKGFLFLLFTISLLVMIQIQTGVLGNKTKTMTTTKRPTKGAAPALGSLGGSCVLLFFTNALIRLFHLS